MKGDLLASGKQRGASFQTGVQAGVEADLKLLSMDDCCLRYDIDRDTWAKAALKYQEDGTVPNWVPITFRTDQTAEASLEYHPMPIQEKAKPTIQYRAIAFGENIIVQRVEKTHSSNLIIPENALAKSDIGFVMSVGEKCQSVQVGKLVMFDAFAAHGNEVKLLDPDGIERESLLLKECDVLAILEKVQSD